MPRSGVVLLHYQPHMLCYGSQRQVYRESKDRVQCAYAHLRGIEGGNGIPEAAGVKALLYHLRLRWRVLSLV